MPQKQKSVNGKGSGICPTCGAELHGPRPKQGIQRNTMKKCSKAGCGEYGCRHCMTLISGGQWRHSGDWCIRLKKGAATMMSALNYDEVIALFERMAEDITTEPPAELYSSMTLGEALSQKGKREQEPA